MQEFTEEIIFRDGPSGLFRQEVINRTNRRVMAMIIQEQFPDQPLKFGSLPTGETQTPDRIAIIPISVMRYLTDQSGFLLVDSTETSKYEAFYPANFVAPDPDWVPPYPYCFENVRFHAK